VKRVYKGKNKASEGWIFILNLISDSVSLQRGLAFFIYEK